MTSPEIAVWVGSGATLLAVIVALFKEEIRGWWRKPKLEASIKLEAPDCHKTKMTELNPNTRQILAEADCYYLRIWVRNAGTQRAQQVQVFAARLCRKQADESFKESAQFLPMNLRWAHAQQSPLGPEIFADGISPGMGKHCDLGHILDPSLARNMGHYLPSVPAGQTILALDLEVAPNTRSHLLGPGTYRLELKLAAGNSRPVAKVVEITLTGQWFADETKMFSEGLGLREVSGL